MNDFDNNGTNDIVLSKKYKEDLVPVRGRECSSQQMPFITQKFESYASFASASLNEIYTPEKLSESVHYKATNFNSIACISNDSGSFNVLNLPIEAQTSCINDVLITDLNGDQRPEIIAIGNQFNTEAETPRYDAFNGLILTYTDNQFISYSVNSSGFFAPFNAKSLNTININDAPYLIVGNNNHTLNMFQLKNYLPMN
jgi:hypothetical protein